MPVSMKSLLGAAATALALAASPALALDEINLLTWCDHTDPELLQPFEQANNARVNVKVYELTGAAVSLLETSQPGDWDVFMVDSADVLRFARDGKLMALDPATLPYADMFPGADLPHLHTLDGKIYGVPEKFGFNTIAYNSQAIGQDGSVSLADLYDPAHTGKIAVYDYYLPVIESIALKHGKKPGEMTLADLETIKPDLFALKKQANIVGDLISTQNALMSGDSVALLGAAEWVMGVQGERPEMAWTIQEEGGLRWSQSLAVFADSKKPDLALKLVQYLMSPEGQARVATASCYWGMPVSSKAALTDEQKGLMQFDKIPEFVANSYSFGAVSPELDAAMNDLWTEFLAQ